VTKSGCLIPAPCHQYGNSKKKPAYEVAMKLFWGKTKNPETLGSVNKFGWPAEEQISHLCHDNACCAFKDLELVPQWQNLKRNYCGFNGVCDCGRIPECKCRYLPSNTSWEYDNDSLLHYGDKNLSVQVKGLLEIDNEELVVKVRILEADHYTIQDQKRENRNLRIKRTKKHEAEHQRNVKRRKK